MKTRTAWRVMRSAALAAGLSLTLAGCESFDITNLIPDSKKKLPGERREVFPGGVPGVSQGVPAELMKGYQAPPEENAAAGTGAGARANTAAAAPAAEPPAEEKKPAAKPKPKRVAKPTPTVAPEYEQDAQPQQSNSGGWPGQQKTPQQSAWPSTPQPGTFSR
jgi:hypothetical protein